jgi:hypothetical protein
MKRAKFKYSEGTIANPQHTKSTEGCFLVDGTNKVHFPDGRMTTIPNYEQTAINMSAGTFSGICRSQWAARRATAGRSGAYYYFGTHTRLYAQYRGITYNITPFKGQTNITLGANPLDTHSGTPTLDIRYTAHNLAVGDVVTLAGAVDIGGFTASAINTSHTIASIINADEFTVTMGTNASSTVNGGGGSAITCQATRPTIKFVTNALSVTNGSNVLTVNYNAHGLSAGDRVDFHNIANFGGITAATYINKEHIIATAATNSFTITLGTTATSTETTGNGKSLCTPVAAGIDYQQLAAGWGYRGAGTFGWGAGILGIGGYSEDEQQYPRIMSFTNFGQDVIICLGDLTAGDGQKIYVWDGDTSIAPTVLLNAPTNAHFVCTVGNTIWALCGNSLRSCEYGNALEWDNALLVENFTVQQSSRLYSMYAMDDNTALVFAPEPFLLRLVGGEWDLVALDAECPIAAPMACCKYLDGLIWYSTDGNFYFFNGGAIKRIINDQCGEYIRQDLNSSAVWTMFMMTDQKHNQAWLFYPAGTNQNPSKYVIVNPAQYGSGKTHFTMGTFDRTSAQRPAELEETFTMTDESMIYNHFLSGESNFSWEATTALFYVDGVNRAKMTRIIPDAYRSGDVEVKVYATENPSDTPLLHSTDTLTSSQGYINPLAAGAMFSLKLSGEKDTMLGDLSIDLQEVGGGLR